MNRLGRTLAVAVVFICGAAKAQEMESPLGGGPVVYGHEPTAATTPDADRGKLSSISAAEGNAVADYGGDAASDSLFGVRSRSSRRGGRGGHGGHGAGHGGNQGHH